MKPNSGSKRKFNSNAKSSKGFKKSDDFKSDTRSSMMGKDKERFSKASYNDASWYIKEGQLAKDVASISFNNALGARTILDTDNPGGSWSTSDLAYGLPGIMAIETVPALGISIGAASPLNIAAKNLYSFVRHQNSGSKNYDSPDLMLYVLAMDSIYSAIIHMQRAYSAALVTSQLNRFVGDALLSAMGFDPSSLRQNLAQFRSMINMLIVKASAFCVPADMSLFRRHAWMYSTIFKDGEIDKSQMYLYRPLGFFRYDETSGGPGKLTFTFSAAGKDPNSEAAYASMWPINTWYSYVDGLLSNLVASEDINIMSGDVLKAYGRDKLFTLSFVSDDAPLNVAYSEEILDQIHNTMFIGKYWRNVLDLTDATQVSTFSTASFDVYQDPNIGTGALHFQPQVMGARHVGIKRILDMYDKEPTPERVLVATRNMLGGIVDNATDSGGQYITISTLTTAGSDICAFAKVYDFYLTASGAWVYRSSDYFPRDGGFAGIIPYAEDYTAFHRAPLVYAFQNSGQGSLTQIIGEIDNFTTLDINTLDKMHESAILSMLGVPV